MNSQKGIQYATATLACLVAAGSLGLVTAARMPRPAASQPKINLTSPKKTVFKHLAALCRLAALRGS